MGRIVSWNGQRRQVDAHYFFRLGARRGVPIKKTLAGRKNDPQVAVQILTGKTLPKFLAARDLSRPWTSFRIHPEAFSAARSLDHSAKAILLGKVVMPRKALTAVYFPTVAAHRPVEQKPARRLRVSRTNCQRDRAAHAPAHDPCRIDLQMVEQRLAMPRVTHPSEPFDSSPGLPALPPVVENHCMLRPQCLHCVYSCPGARRTPLVDRRVKAAGCTH